MGKIHISTIKQSEIADQIICAVKRRGITPKEISDLIQDRYDARYLCQLTTDQLVDLHNHLISL